MKPMNMLMSTTSKLLCFSSSSFLQLNYVFYMIRESHLLTGSQSTCCLREDWHRNRLKLHNFLHYHEELQWLHHFPLIINLLHRGHLLPLMFVCPVNNLLRLPLLACPSHLHQQIMQGKVVYHRLPSK